MTMSFRPGRRFLLACLAVGALASGRPAAASQVLAMDLPELTARAERIVVAEVLSVKSGWDGSHKRIVSTVELHVSEVWKGQVSGDGHVTVVQPGGVADGVEMIVHGMPSFQSGERAVLFLRGAQGKPASVVGMGQGKRILSFEKAGNRWMVGTGDRSAVMNIDTKGRLVSPEGERPLPLDDMRRQVGLLVKHP
jgi:hypothetical protein